jgi:predicted nucleotidyltransferase
MTSDPGKNLIFTDIMKLSEQIARTYKPQRIILFGSYAYGTPNEDSDVDMLVIMSFEGKNPEMAAQILNQTDPHFPIDLLVRTPDQVLERLKSGDFFIKEIIERGKVLYEATHTRMD